MRRNAGALVTILLVTVALPWIGVTFAPPDAGMAVGFLLFFGLNPMCSMFAGIWAGMDGKNRWYLPLVYAAAYLLGAWGFFAPGEPVFLGFAGAYLGISLLAMAVTVLVRRGIRRESAR